MNRRTAYTLAPLGLFALFVIVSAIIAPPLADPEPAGDILHSQSLNDVKRTDATYYDVGRLPNGSVRVAFEDTTVDCSEEGLTPECGLTGVRIIDPETGAIQWEYAWKTTQQYSTEVHDAEYLPDRDEMLIADMEAERIFTVDMATKAVTWEWRAASVYQQPSNPLAVDWLHINDVDRVEPGVYMVSVRNADQILFIERGCTCVVDMVNPSSDSRLINKQHNPQYLGDGVMLVSDSENDRVVQLERQEPGDWRVTWTLYEVDEQPLDWPRDVDRLPNGHLLITDTGNRRIVETTTDGELVRSYDIDPDGHVYEADANGTEYPAGEPIDGEAAPVRGQPIGLVSWAYNSLNYWLGLPHWINEWHVLYGALAALASGGQAGWRRWSS